MRSSQYHGNYGQGLSRRRFLSLASSLTLNSALFLKRMPRLDSYGQESSVASPSAAILSFEEVEVRIRPHFQCDDTDLWRLTVDAYRRCVFGGLRPPEPPFIHTWFSAGGAGDHFVGQWLWDTMFVVDLLSILPDQRDTIRGIFQNYWDFQERWNAAKPEYAHGMVANFIAPYSVGGSLPGTGWREYPAYSQAPLLAWGMERVFRRNGDKELLQAGAAHLEEFHEWYWRERDLRNTGLVCVGSYSGDIQHARYETYDNEVDLDGLALTKHPDRKGQGEGQWYGDICIPANTSYLLLSEACLVRIATTLGDHAMAERRRRKLEKGVKAMHHYMWDDSLACFLAVRRDSLEKIPVATIGGLVPLMAGIPTKQQAARMAETLSEARWATRLPIPTVDRQNPHFVSNSYWRGDVWPAPDYQVAAGLGSYGHKNVAARIADTMIDNAIRVGISEHYDSLTGEPLGVRGLGMSAVMVSMALDGLTSTRKLKAV